jgi:TolB-like protein/class 3 adenylate cyclase/Flp pilus assembly protein TadD
MGENAPVRSFDSIYLYMTNMHRKESSRHLAAILFTDIVGYTSMMQRDEGMAMASVRKHQELLEKLVKSHDGEVYQYYGDGSLNIFHSAIQAVSCALELQKEMLQEPAVPLKIGIHIGEIYTEGGKIFGDGVNVASRIESIGQGGTVLFSKEVFEKVRNNTSFQIQSIGKFEFKNVEEPVEVYALSNPEVRVPDLKAIEGKLKEQPKHRRVPATYWMGALILVLVAGYFLALRQKPVDAAPENGNMPKSIAVLPFKSLSEGEDEDFLSIGIAEDILIQLAQIQDLKVISRSSSMRYKDSDKAIKSIARDLGVSSILEGSVRKFGDNLRVSVQLIHGVDESLIWAANFDRQFKDVLNVQRDVALAVAEKLKIALTPEIKHRFENKSNIDPEAYLHYQRGQDILLRSSGTREDMMRAIGFFKKAVELDSTFARAWIGLSDAYTEAIFWHRMRADEALPEAKNAAAHAIAIDDQLGEAYGALGSIDYIERKFVASELNLKRAIELNPSYSWAYERLGWIKVIRGEFDEALALFMRAIELDPLFSRYKGSVGNALAVAGQYEKGIRLTTEFLKQDPNDNFILWTLGYLYARTGEYHKAIEVLSSRTIGTKTNWVLGYAFAKTGQRDKAEEILKYNVDKSKSQLVPDFMLAVQYAGLGMDQEALMHLEKGVRSLGESFFVIGLKDDPFFTSLHDHPEFQKILEIVDQDFTLAADQ